MKRPQKQTRGKTERGRDKAKENIKEGIERAHVSARREFNVKRREKKGR